MRLLLVLMALALLPAAQAQEGFFVRAHNVTYQLGEGDFSVEETIVFESTGTSTGNLFNDNIYLTRGNAKDVEVGAAGDVKYSVHYLDSTVINLNLVIWRGESRKITLRYNRSDMLFSQDNVYFFKGVALGKYTWVPDNAMIKFIAPAGFQFGAIAPPAPKTIENKKETINYSVSPKDLNGLNIIKEGIPVYLEYAKYDELSVSETRAARESIEDAESEISGANKTIENALQQTADPTQVLTLHEIASTRLEESKNSLLLAEIKSNQHSEGYSPYEAYYYAKQSRNLSKEAQRKAGEAKDLANYQIQQALEERISGITSKLKEAPGEEYPETYRTTTQENGNSLFKITGIALLMLLGAAVIFDIYRKTGGQKKLQRRKKSAVDDFKAIDALKRKSFSGFDKKLDSVKHGTDLAARIRDLKKRMEEMESEKSVLERKRDREELDEELFEIESRRLKKDIDEAALRISELKSQLGELKRHGR